MSTVMDKMKKFKIKGVLDGLRSSVNTPAKTELDITETLRSEHFEICKTVRHGFPFQPTALAYDPVQHILAIGTKSGSLRIFGRPGVDCHCCHPEEAAVIQILFLINEGALVTVCSDDTLHLWNYRQKRPDIVHTLKFMKERITYCHLPFQSKWFYIGTERGNVHIVNIETFSLSGYVINWNKAIELSRKTHPGPVVHLEDNPIDPSRLLIGFESGAVVVWDLKNKTAELRFSTPEALRSLSWWSDGKQFMGSHSDGSLTTWNLKTNLKATNITMPHAKPGKDGKLEPCKPIKKIEWKSVRGGEPLIIFSGGMPYDKVGRTPSITVMNGKSITVLEMEHNIVDFVVLCETPWQNDFQVPYAIVVLLQNDLVVVDLTVQGYPCFENPYPMDIHESPVTACQYYADCPPDLIPAFYSVGSKQKKTGFSENGWPIKGGEWGTTTCSYPEIILTGHADGSVKFWDASAVTLQVLCKVKSAKLFEKPKCKNSDGSDDDPFAIQMMQLCRESRLLCVAGATHVMLFRFDKQESQHEVVALEIQIIYEVYDDLDSPDYEYSRPFLGAVHQQQSGSLGSYSSSASDSTKYVQEKKPPLSWSGAISLEYSTALKVKPSQRRWNPGFQPDIVCLLAWIDNEHPGNVTSICVNSSYGLMAFGNESGLAVVDIIQKICLLNIGTPDLYGSMDPYQRAPRSPRGKRPQPLDANNTGQIFTDECKSPTSDQSLLPLASHPRPVSSGSTPCGGEEEEEQQLVHHLPHTQTPQVAIEPTPMTTKSYLSSESICEKTDSTKDNNETWTIIEVETERSESQTEESVSFHVMPPVKTVPHRTKSNKLPKPSEAVTPIKRSPSESNIRKRNSPKDDDSVFCSSSSSRNLHENRNCISREAYSDVNLTQSIPDTNITSPGANCKDSETSILRKMSSSLKALSIKVKGSLLDVGHDTRKYKPPRRFGDIGKVDVIDLTKENESSHKRHMSRSEIFKGLFVDKNDGSSFSRSRSSSMSSLENVSKEAIQCLKFSDSYTRKTDSYTCPCLWVGTSLGSVLVIVLNLPSQEQRNFQPVIVSPSGTIFRLKGAILTMSFLDCNGVLVPDASVQWEDKSKLKIDPRDAQAQKTNAGINYKKVSPTTVLEVSDRQFAIICSEKQARVMSLPSQTCAYKVKITETSFVVKSEIVSIKDSVCLACYVANGRIVTFSLPSLKPLMDAPFQPLTEIRVARTFCFSNNGHAMYLCTPTELQKVTYSAEMRQNLNEMLGDLFLPCETPEAPKQGFFKNLFGGGSVTVDREELFGETSGKAAKGMAKFIAGSGGMHHLTAQSTSVGGEVARTKQLFHERGEKLEGLEDRTQQMTAQAESYSQVAHQLMLKYKDKKWYQF
ncbi:syntaxin-binding protein 5 isoform X2 [Octopus bimaculoides]|uniref:syntaxin-binding protein 5 isoform X2 n=1 Tax=Octopus bimaculoides TaxID=37653 RepID=UPI0022DFEACB|nr:syntaxin-binding protein 5 isoform X2 [Octopus bimaculoides]